MDLCSWLDGTITAYGPFEKQQNSYILDLREAMRV
jgi:hypothetical protein